MEKTFRLCCVITTERLLPLVDGPHQGSRPQSIKWTDPTRVKLIQIHKVDRLHQGSRPVHKVDGPNQGHKLIQIHKVDRLHQRSRPIHKVDGPDQGHKLIQIHKVDRLHQGSRPVHKVDGPDQGHKLIQIHKVDRLHQGSRPQSTKWTGPTRVTNLYKSIKWTDSIKGQDHSPQSGRPQPGSQTFTKSAKWTNPTKGQDQSTKWTNLVRVKNLNIPKVDRSSIKTHVHDMDGPNNGQNSRLRRGRTQLRSNLFK